MASKLRRRFTQVGHKVAKRVPDLLAMAIRKATTGRRGSISWFDHELGHTGGVCDLLYLDDERRNLRLRRDPLAEFEELAFDLRGLAPYFLEFVYLLLHLLELGLFVLPRLGLLVQTLEKWTQEEKVVADDDDHNSKYPQDEDVTIVATHRRPRPVCLVYCSPAAP